MKKHLKFAPSDWDKTVCILFLLIFLPIKVNLILKKKYNKKNLVRAFGSNDDKIIFKILTKIIVFNMRFIAIHI